MKISIIFLIVLFTAGTAMATSPIYKNCGKTVSDSICTDSACRTDFDPATVITNCEMDFAVAQPAGFATTCTWSPWQQVSVTVSADSSHLNIIPVAPLTSLAGLHVYTICWVKPTIQPRQ